VQYLVEGADRSSGEDRTVIFSAENEADLRRQIEAMGILVSNAKPWSPPTPVQYATPAPSQTTNLPNYIGLQIASLVLGISCVCFYLAALVLLIAGLLAMNSNAPSQPFMPSPAATAPFDLAAALGAFAAAAIQHGLSTGCKALRDIARNSFARRMDRD
jgi:hypothetical protein